MNTKRTRLTIALTAVAVGAFLGACAEENTPVSGPNTTRAIRNGAPSESVYPEERPFWDLAQKYPGTAGFFRDPVTDDIVVSLIDMQNAAGVKALLRVSLAKPLARARKRNPRADVVARQATYTFLQLKEWRDRMNEALALPGVDWLDLDEATNRVVIGVDPGTEVQSIRRLGRELGVPEKAIDFEVDGPIVPKLGLQDSVRPIAGGTQIQTDNAAHTLRVTCTLSFPALWNGTRAFLTASHCSHVKYVVDSTPQYQPNLPLTHTDSINHAPIGFEVADYPMQPCPPNVNGTACLWADASVYQFTGDPAQWVLGRIARPTFGCFPTACNPPNYQIGGYFSIARIRSNIMQNDLVSVVGDSSGWIQSTVVTSTCVNDKIKQTSIVIRCQQHAGFVIGEGDSGGPALFDINPLPDSTVSLGGIFWAASAKSSSFSPWSGIVQEYPGLVVF